VSEQQRAELLQKCLDAAVERHLAHMFDVYLQGTDDARLSRLKNGIKRLIESYNLVAAAMAEAEL
jgi:hypothetical protein